MHEKRLRQRTQAPERVENRRKDMRREEEREERREDERLVKNSAQIKGPFSKCVSSKHATESSRLI
jgi:hypothetical protein